MKYVPGTIWVLIIVAALFILYSSNQHSVQAQGVSIPITEIDVNGVKVVPNNGVINIISNNHSIYANGNTIILDMPR